MADHQNTIAGLFLTIAVAEAMTPGFAGADRAAEGAPDAGPSAAYR
jgi:hypothetical protein